MPPGTIIPELVYPDLAAAVAWLAETFGFRERLRIGDHRSQLVFDGGSMVVVGGGDTRPKERTHSVMVRVGDVDKHYDKVRRSGARIVRPPETYPFGERQYTVEDPGGHVWTFTQSVANVAPEEWGGKRVGPL